MNCRGHERRVQIVNNYNIECAAHIRLLNGRMIRSDAERDITETYYIFICTDKKNPAIVEQICCGEGAGNDILRLANIQRPPIFNMLHEENDNNQNNEHNNDNQNDDYNNGNNNNNPRIIWNETARQLYDAIMILITAWNLQPGPIFDYLKDVKKFRNLVPFPYKVQRINNILQRHNTSMRNIINELNENNNFKEYHFDLLENVLHENNTISYFEDANGI